MITSDWHVDTYIAGVPLLDNFYKFRDIVVDVLRKENIDVFLFTGDAFDPGSRLDALYTATIIDTAYLFSNYVSESYWIAGNHDVVETRNVLTTLSPLKCARIKNTAVLEHPVRYFGRYFELIALPYVSRSAYNEDFYTVLEHKVKNMPLIVAGHMTVPGAMMGSESREMARGRDLDLPIDKIAKLEPSLVVNGHYHNSQIIKAKNGLEILVPGSPFKMNFGETGDTQKGYTIVELEV